MLFAPLLAGNIGDICLLDPALRESPLEIITDDEACAVAVGQHDQAARFGNAADDLKLILVIEDTKAAGFEDYRVDHLTDGIDIVAALHENRFTQFYHDFAPFTSAAMSSSVSSISFCLSTALPCSSEAVRAQSEAARRSTGSGSRRAALCIFLA